MPRPASEPCLLFCLLPQAEEGEEEEEEEAAAEGFYKPSKTSILFGGGVLTEQQRETAKAYALDMLRLSAASNRFLSVVSRPRHERGEHIRSYQREHEAFIAEKARLLARWLEPKSCVNAPLPLTPG